MTSDRRESGWIRVVDLARENEIASKIRNRVYEALVWRAFRTGIRRLSSQKLTKVPLLLERSRKGVHKAGVDRAVIIETVHVEKPECFAPLGYLGYRPAHGCAPVILGERKLLVSNFSSEKEVSRVQLIVAEKIV